MKIIIIWDVLMINTIAYIFSYITITIILLIIITKLTSGNNNYQNILNTITFIIGYIGVMVWLCIMVASEII